MIRALLVFAVACAGDINPTTGLRTNEIDDNPIVNLEKPPFTIPKLAICGNGVVEGSEACDDGNTVNGDSCSADCTESLTFDYKPGLSSANTHQLPPCNDSSCVVQCTAFASGALWRCADGSSNAYTLVPGTETSTLNPWGLSAINVFSDANAPTITTIPSAVLTAMQSPHTVIVTAQGNNPGTATFPFEIHNGTDFFYVRDEGGSEKCDWSNIASGGTTFVDVVKSTTNSTYNHGYSMITARKTGTGGSSVYSCRINGEQATNSSFAKDPAALTGATVYFGKHRTSAGLNPNGQIESVTIYNVAKTDTEVTTLENRWAGIDAQVSQTTNPLTYAGHDVWLQASTGFYYPVGYNVPRVTSAGFVIEMNNSNPNLVAGNNQTSFATDNTDVSSWTAVGTPTNATNVVSGPFSAFKNAAECDRIVDADAGTFDGYKSPISLGTYTGPVTYSFILAQGDTGTTKTKAHIAITTDGTGATTCDKTIAVGAGPGGTAIYSCTTNIGGSPTFTKGEIDVGNAASDTGSIIVCAAWADGHPYANTARIPRASVTTGAGLDSLKAGSTEVAAWHQHGHSEQIIFTPAFNWTDIVSFADPKMTGYEPLDLFNVGQTDHREIMYHLTNEGINPVLGLRGNGVLSGNPPTDTDTVASSNATEVAGHTYAWRTDWQFCPDNTHVKTFIYFDECLSGADSCYATTLIGSDATCAAKLPPASDWGGFNIGCRYTNTLCVEGLIKRASIWARP